MPPKDAKGHSSEGKSESKEIKGLPSTRIDKPTEKLTSAVRHIQYQILSLYLIDNLVNKSKSRMFLPDNLLEKAYRALEHAEIINSALGLLTHYLIEKSLFKTKGKDSYSMEALRAIMSLLDRIYSKPSTIPILVQKILSSGYELATVEKELDRISKGSRTYSEEKSIDSLAWIELPVNGFNLQLASYEPGGFRRVGNVLGSKSPIMKALYDLQSEVDPFVHVKSDESKADISNIRFAPPQIKKLLDILDQFGAFANKFADRPGMLAPKFKNKSASEGVLHHLRYWFTNQMPICWHKAKLEAIHQVFKTLEKHQLLQDQYCTRENIDFCLDNQSPPSLSNSSSSSSSSRGASSASGTTTSGSSSTPDTSSYAVILDQASEILAENKLNNIAICLQLTYRNFRLSKEMAQLLGDLQQLSPKDAQGVYLIYIKLDRLSNRELANLVKEWIEFRTEVRKLNELTSFAPGQKWWQATLDLNKTNSIKDLVKIARASHLLMLKKVFEKEIPMEKVHALITSLFLEYPFSYRLLSYQDESIFNFIFEAPVELLSNRALAFIIFKLNYDPVFYLLSSAPLTFEREEIMKWGPAAADHYYNLLLFNVVQSKDCPYYQNLVINDGNKPKENLFPVIQAIGPIALVISEVALWINRRNPSLRKDLFKLLPSDLTHWKNAAIALAVIPFSAFEPKKRFENFGLICSWAHVPAVVQGILNLQTIVQRKQNEAEDKLKRAEFSVNDREVTARRSEITAQTVLDELFESQPNVVTRADAKAFNNAMPHWPLPTEATALILSFLQKPIEAVNETIFSRYLPDDLIATGNLLAEHKRDAVLSKKFEHTYTNKRVYHRIHDRLVRSYRYAENEEKFKEGLKEEIGGVVLSYLQQPVEHQEDDIDLMWIQPIKPPTTSSLSSGVSVARLQSPVTSTSIMSLDSEPSIAVEESKTALVESKEVKPLPLPPSPGVTTSSSSGSSSSPFDINGELKSYLVTLLSKDMDETIKNSTVEVNDTSIVIKFNVPSTNEREVAKQLIDEFTKINGFKLQRGIVVAGLENGVVFKHKEFSLRFDKTALTTLLASNRAAGSSITPTPTPTPM